MHDFDLTWRQKLSDKIEARAGTTTRDEILPENVDPTHAVRELDVIGWTRVVMNRMACSLDMQTSRDIMSDCACHYPEDQLKPMRALYETTGDLQQVHAALQNEFETFLREILHLDETMIAEVVNRGWGSAGVLDGDTIIATKIPKSGYLREYLQESDPEVRRSMYCHCPRVRDAVGTGEELPRIYCYCGAGFYKHMWETILQDEIEIEVLESVLSGGEVCKVAIRLPAGL